MNGYLKILGDATIVLCMSNPHCNHIDFVTIDERWPLPLYKCEYSLEVPPVSVHRCYSRCDQDIPEQHKPVDVVRDK